VRREVNDRVSPRNPTGETVAISALGFLAGDPTRLSRFLALSGLGPHNLRAAAADPGFLAAVLDYIAGDESLLMAFAEQEGTSPAEFARARDSLGGARPAVDP
jgi:Protein of unknown function (DUF3572)